MSSGSKLRLAIVNFVECMCRSNPWKEGVERGKESHRIIKVFYSFFKIQSQVCHLKIAKIADPVGTTGITILSPFLPFASKPRRSGFLSLMMR